MRSDQRVRIGKILQHAEIAHREHSRGRRDDIEAGIGELSNGTPHVGRVSDQDNAVHACRREYARGVSRVLKRVVGFGVDPPRLDPKVSLQRIVHRAGLERKPGDENRQPGFLGEVRAVAQPFEHERFGGGSLVLGSQGALAAAAENYYGLCVGRLVKIHRWILFRETRQSICHDRSRQQPQRRQAYNQAYPCKPRPCFEQHESQQREQQRARGRQDQLFQQRL